MPTNETKIWQALKAKINSLGLTYPIIYPSTEYTPSSEIYIQISHFPNYSDYSQISSPDSVRYKGILQIELAFPIIKKFSFDVMQEQIANIAAAFKASQAMAFQDVIIKLEKKPDLLTSYRQDGFFFFPISIRYYSFIGE